MYQALFFSFSLSKKIMPDRRLLDVLLYDKTSSVLTRKSLAIFGHLQQSLESEMAKLL